MRVLLATLGSAGDVHPILGIGLALRARGHTVTIITNDAFAEPARRLGLDFIALGRREDAERIMRDPDLWHPTRGFGVIANRVILPNVAPLYAIVARHDPGNTVVFASPMCLGARIAQERLGFRLVTHHLAPALFWSRFRPPASTGPPFDRLPAPFQSGLHRLVVAIVDRALAPTINDFRKRLGLPPVRDVLYRWCNSPQRVIGLFPHWFALPQPDWPPQVRLTGFPLFDPPDADDTGADSAAPLSDGPPPIVFTPGSANIRARAFFEAAVEASQRLGRPALLLTRYPHQLPTRLPVAVVHRDYVPLQTLLPRAAAIVHHGGIGTTAQGLAAGIPQVIMPMSHDQPENAARLRRLGVGIGLSPRHFTGRVVAEALDRLLRSEEVLGRCRELAARCDREANIETARLIEEAGR